MDEKEKYRAEIDARMIKLGETLHEIKTKMEKRKENLSNIGLDATIRNYEKARAKLEDLERANENTWKHVKAEIEKLYDDIDDDLRKTIAYFG